MISFTIFFPMYFTLNMEAQQTSNMWYISTSDWFSQYSLKLLFSFESDHSEMQYH